jgi:hypothetical protein
MSDYLTRLAWRALGLIPSAQPRVLSRFADGADAQFELPPERWDDNRPPERIPILEDPEPPATAMPPPAARRPAAAAPAPPRASHPSEPSAPGGGEENLANATNPETAEPAVEAPAAEPPAVEEVQEPGPAEWGEQIAERAASEVMVGAPALPSLSESFPVSFPEGFQEGSEVAPHPPAPSPIPSRPAGRGGEVVAGALGEGAVQRWGEEAPEGSAGVKPGVSTPGTEAASSPRPVGTQGETWSAAPETTPTLGGAPSPAPRGRIGEGAAPAPPLPPVAQRRAETTADLVPPTPVAPHPPAPSPIAPPSSGRGGELVAGRVEVDGVQDRAEVAVDPVRSAPVADAGLSNLLGEPEASKPVVSTPGASVPGVETPGFMPALPLGALDSSQAPLRVAQNSPMQRRPETSAVPGAPALRPVSDQSSVLETVAAAPDPHPLDPPLPHAQPSPGRGGGGQEVSSPASFPAASWEGAPLSREGVVRVGEGPGVRVLGEPVLLDSSTAPQSSPAVNSLEISQPAPMSAPRAPFDAVSPEGELQGYQRRSALGGDASAPAGPAIPASPLQTASIPLGLEDHGSIQAAASPTWEPQVAPKAALEGTDLPRTVASAPSAPVVQRRPANATDVDREDGEREAPRGSAGVTPGVSTPGTEAASLPRPVETQGAPPPVQGPQAPSPIQAPPLVRSSDPGFESVAPAELSNPWGEAPRASAPGVETPGFTPALPLGALDSAPLRPAVNSLEISQPSPVSVPRARAEAEATPPGDEPPGYEKRSALRGDASTLAALVVPASGEAPPAIRRHPESSATPGFPALGPGSEQPMAPETMAAAPDPHPLGPPLPHAQPSPGRGGRGQEISSLEFSTVASWEGAPLSREGVVRVGEGPGVRVPEVVAPAPSTPSVIQRTPDTTATPPAPVRLEGWTAPEPPPAVNSLEISQPSPFPVSTSAPAASPLVERRPESPADPEQFGWEGEAPRGSAGIKPGVSTLGGEAAPAWEAAPSPASRGRVGEGAAPAPPNPSLVQRRAEVPVDDVPVGPVRSAAPGVETPGFTPALPLGALATRASLQRAENSFENSDAPSKSPVPSWGEPPGDVERSALRGDASAPSAPPKPGVSTPGTEAPSLPRPVGTPGAPPPVRDSQAPPPVRVSRPGFESVAPAVLANALGEEPVASAPGASLPVASVPGESLPEASVPGASALGASLPGVETPGFTPALPLGALDSVPLRPAVNALEISQPAPVSAPRAPLGAEAERPMASGTMAAAPNPHPLGPPLPHAQPSPGRGGRRQEASPVVSREGAPLSREGVVRVGEGPGVRVPEATVPTSSTPTLIQRTPETAPQPLAAVNSSEISQPAPVSAPRADFHVPVGLERPDSVQETASLAWEPWGSPPATPDRDATPHPAPSRPRPSIPAAIQRRPERAAASVSPVLRPASEQPSASEAMAAAPNPHPLDPPLPHAQPAPGRGGRGQEASSPEASPVVSWEVAPLSREGVVRVGEGPGVRVPEVAASAPSTPTLIQRSPDPTATSPTPTLWTTSQPSPAVNSLEISHPAPVSAPPAVFGAEPAAGWAEANPTREADLLAHMDNLLLGRPGPNLLPPAPLSPPASAAWDVSAPEVIQRQAQRQAEAPTPAPALVPPALVPAAPWPVAPRSFPQTAERGLEPASLLATPAAPPRIKGTALEQELLAQVDRLLLGRPGPNTDFLALAAQAPLRTPDPTLEQPPRSLSATPAADPGPVWEVAPEALPAPASPIRPVVAPRTELQQPAAEPARKPTFEVTIGRLEVVAPPPEAPQQQQPRRPAPKTSLQDYLDRRRVGR